jgi:two-component system OmpR family sensor kinase/two-component system sensor histidine kinase BaeS
VRIRLILSFLLVISLSLIGVSLLVRQNAQQELQTFLGRGGLIGAESLAAELEAWYQMNGSWNGAEALMPHNEPGTGEGGTGGAGAGGPQQGLRRLIQIRLANANGIILYDPLNPNAVGSTILVEPSSIPLIVDGKTVGYLLPQEDSYAQENAQFEERFLERINAASLAAAAISGSVALVLALLLAYFLIQPVNVLIGATEKIAHGDLSYRVAIKKPKELARLGATFNAMAGELEQADLRRKNLTSDIAHELRTPLAVQQAHLEALADGVFALTKENLDPIQEQNSLLTRLVEDLRLITLADAGELQMDLQPVDMRALVSSVVEQFSAKAKEKLIAIQTDLQACRTVQADPQRLQQILHNLLQNAVRYTPEKGVITIQVACSQHKLTCSVRDAGPGIPLASLPFIFDRFYRAERARAKADGGTGLGLAIARNLAQAHGGSLTARNHPQGGAEFILTLPLGSTAPQQFS